MKLYNLLFENSVEVNWIYEESRIAEEFISNVIHAADELVYVEPREIYNKYGVLETIQMFSEERYNLVKDKLKDLQKVDIDEIDIADIFDRTLGIDIMFEYRGVRYCADVTTGGRSIVNNKVNKFIKLEDTLNTLGIEKCTVFRVNKSLEVKLEDVIDELMLLLNNWDNFKPTIYKKPHKRQPSGNLVRIIHI